jgi:hypothetical protein
MHSKSRGFIVAVACAAAFLASPSATQAADKGAVTTLTTSALEFNNAFVCSVTNVGSTPINVTVALLSPQSGEPLGNSVLVAETVQPGFGTSNFYLIAVGFTSAYCRVTHTSGVVRAAACTKASQPGSCEAVSEAR